MVATIRSLITLPGEQTATLTIRRSVTDRAIGLGWSKRTAERRLRENVRERTAKMIEQRQGLDWELGLDWVEQIMERERENQRE